MAGSETPCPSHTFTRESSNYMDRGQFLARLSKVAEDCWYSDLTLCKNGVIITKCPPFILAWVMRMVEKGHIPTYNVSVDRGGVLVTFDV
jgi:hypothetical protein